MNDIILVRCNHCMTIMEETADNNVVECSKCGKDDALMTGFVDYTKQPPTPLSISKRSAPDFPMGEGMRHVGLESEGELIATVWNHHNSTECDARAAFIIRAANAHDEMEKLLTEFAGLVYGPLKDITDPKFSSFCMRVGKCLGGMGHERII